MQIHTRREGEILIADLSGRLDAHGAAVLQQTLDFSNDEARHLVLDLGEVPYLSSAGLRVFVLFHKECTARNGVFSLAKVQPYCREVLRVGGMDTLFTPYEGIGGAVAAIQGETGLLRTEHGSFEALPGSDEPGGIEILGHIEDVLASRVTEAHVRSKHFFAKEYSLGLGGMAASTEEALPVMGEMITIGGTMVWLPTDGYDTPDFLIPKVDSDLVTIRTGFNASLRGHFNEFFHFRSASPEGCTMSELYRSLFDLAAKRRPDYKGAIGLAMRAEVKAAYGAGVVKSPIAANAPENGKWITDASNFKQWFEFDAEPRLREVTGLISGVGVDLRHDLSAFSQDSLNATFYINPANTGSADEQLHNHGVFFSPLPFGETPGTLEEEIAAVVEAGDFVDMRHLLDGTTITRALIGVIYVQDFWPDPTG